VISNAFRIAVAGYLTVHVSPQTAEGFFHGFSGWLIFMFSFAGMALLSLLLRNSSPRKNRAVRGQAKEVSRAANGFEIGKVRLSYLWTASVLCVLFWGANAALASAQITPSRKPFAEFPSQIGFWKGEKVFLSEEILGSLWADDYVNIRLWNKKTGNQLILFVPYYEYQGTMHTAHAPASCLVGGGFSPLSKKKITRHFPGSSGEVQIGQMVLEKSRQVLLSNYWFHQRGRIIESEYANKWYLFWDSMTRRRTDGALVRVEMLLREGQKVEEAQAEVDEFTRELMRILPEYVPD
jgi:EpsI family protein